MILTTIETRLEFYLLCVVCGYKEAVCGVRTTSTALLCIWTPGDFAFGWLPHRLTGQDRPGTELGLGSPEHMQRTLGLESHRQSVLL